MALINTISRQEANGIVKQGYEKYLNHLGVIPRPMEVLSCSPALFALQLERNAYFAAHEKLSFALLTHIRYLVSHNLGYRFCMDFNRHLLKKQGVEDEDIARMEEDPSRSLLEEDERAMLVFVVKAVKKPGAVTAKDIEQLRELGWTDRDVVDGLAHGVGMLDHAIMMEAFQMDQNCMID